MTRPRLASAVLAAGLGLVCGCTNDFSFRNMFSRQPAAVPATCCEGGCCPVDCPTCPCPTCPCGIDGCPSCAGSVSGFEGPILAPPPGPVVPVMPGPIMPPVASAPHLVPAPAVPMPYTP